MCLKYTGTRCFVLINKAGLFLALFFILKNNIVFFLDGYKTVSINIMI